MAKSTEKQADVQPSVSETKMKLAQGAIEQIEKQFGKGSIMRLNDANVVPVEAIPTGCLFV